MGFVVLNSTGDSMGIVDIEFGRVFVNHLGAQAWGASKYGVPLLTPHEGDDITGMTRAGGGITDAGATLVVSTRGEAIGDGAAACCTQ